jgi:WD repeat-containing protein 76
MEQRVCWCNAEQCGVGAYFHPGGKSSLVTTSYDDTIRIWSSSGGDWSESRRQKHNNQTGRWISPFKAIWAPDGSTVFCGDMKRGLFCMDAESGGGSLLTSDLVTAISPRLACHAEVGIVAMGSGSGRVHLWTPAHA